MYSIKTMNEKYKLSGRPVKVTRGKHTGYGSKLANCEKGKTLNRLAKKAGK